ncbi:hypothetical protein D5b_00484 [Faustovirus]|nr:hypothetical protein D5b_00484 [Faustovirus]AMN84436.1 hypothetical protein D6_00024 [Faustovirus]AMP44422.1 hypothetical protein PRJ_Dakar_00472 [Faustovirus]QKE50134.1 hypothetical protein F-VV10_0014 [Faustovirus]
MAIYFNNGGNGNTAFPGFTFGDTKAQGKSFYAEVNQYRHVNVNSDIVSYFVVGETTQYNWEDFDGCIRWMFALDRSGGIWFNVHGKCEGVSYDKWQLYPLTHDYFNKRVNMGCFVFYSNGVEYRGSITAMRGITDSTTNMEILKAIKGYKNVINALNTPVVGATNYTATVNLFKRGKIIGIDGWTMLTRANLDVKFKFTGVDANVPFDAVECLAFTRYSEIRNILTVTRVNDDVYEYSLKLCNDIEGFWFCDKATGRRLDVELVDLRV